MSKLREATETKQKTCFIISPIGSKDTETRLHFDQVKRHIIDPIATKKGYLTTRADEIPKPGTITKQIITHLNDADLVFADLTEKNPNVFYELAVRHAVGKPVILMGAIGDIIPFDLAAQRVIFYDRDPDNMETARRKLSEQIEEVNSDTFVVDSPIKDVFKLEPSTRRSTRDDTTNEIIAILRTQSERLRNIEENTQTRDSDIIFRPLRSSSLTYSPRISSISPNSGPPGTQVIVTSYFHTSGTDVMYYFDTVHTDAIAIGTSEPDGKCMAIFKIPRNARHGTHSIIIKDVITNSAQILEFEVT
jgi:hypothetical protein